MALTTTSDPNQLVMCPTGHWQGTVQNAVCQHGDVVRCPECLDPVTQVLLAGFPIIFDDKLLRPEWLKDVVFLGTFV